MMRLFFILLLCFSSIAQAMPVDEFAKLPILHEGRVKPIDSFARIHFKEAPNETLAKALFTPAKAMDQPLFELPLPQLQQILQLPEQEAYSYNDLALRFDAIRPALKAISNKDSNKFTATEKALWGLYSQVQALSQIIRAFSWAFKVDGSDKNYLELRNEREALLAKVKKTIARKGENVASYSKKEQQEAKLSLELTSLALTGGENNLFKVIPSTNEDFVAPWEVIEGGKGSPQSGEGMKQWQALAMAYANGDVEQWNSIISELKQPNWKLDLELLYNALPWITLIAALYCLSLIFFCVTPTKAAAQSRWVLAYAGISFFNVALLMHGGLILGRILLLGRPPVSTLYESILFVAFASAAFSYWIAKRKNIPEAMPIAALLGGGLMLASEAYVGQGDTMGVLIAVLNTNIWLATHVICITIGYALCLVVGTMAHVALLRESLIRYLPFLAVIALLFTAVGTILGGIWADQSWGRFWGWDPKENGALLIVLWLAWLLHARMMNSLGERVYLASLALTNIIVALSWFGVNLLNTGLHSYGFTDSAALGLFWFCAIEFALIVALFFYPRIVCTKA